MGRARWILLALLIARPALADRHRVTAKDDADAKARAALAVIDGTAWVGDATPHAAAHDEDRGKARRNADDDRANARRNADDDRANARRNADISDDRADARRIASQLQPWRATILGGGGSRTDRGARLDGAEHLDEGDGMHVRRPQRAYGEPYVVDNVRRAVAEVRALYPDVPTLAIGDLSSEHGGDLPGHVSHKTGRDVDVGFYFHHAATGFENAGDDLDLQATWALLVAFARTADDTHGVQIIFLDYAVQKRLYEFAHSHGTPDGELAHLLQYPRGKDAGGLVRHWPNHANHFHVRFKP